MKHPYLIHIPDEENWLFPTRSFADDGTIMEEQRNITLPQGDHRLFTFTDSLMHRSISQDACAPVFMHDHHKGFETFFVESGSMTLFVDGKRTLVEKGSVIHLQPYQAHGMIFHDPVIYRGSFHDWNCIDDAASTSALEQYHPDAKKNPEFMNMLIGSIDMHFREPAVDYAEAAAYEVSAVRHPDRPLAQFYLDGATLKLITARWENAGVNELWRAELEPGFHAEWTDYPSAQELYYINQGSVKFKVYDEEFVAGPDCLVKIPKFAVHSLEALEKSAIYDLGGLTEWYALLGDYMSIKKREPEKLKDAYAMSALKAKYGCQIKSFGYK
jgi:mannose-6-phosphate isomerase-like protein (cupin superfamily)